MAHEWTFEKLKALSAETLLDLYKRAEKQNSAEGKSIVEIILSNDLLVQSDGGYPREHPIIMEMEEIISSPLGTQAAKKAADNGQPAMAGVDPLLQERLGLKYGARDTTSWAGTFVADQMRKMGYKKVHDSRPLPSFCRAKTAAYFESGSK